MGKVVKLDSTRAGAAAARAAGAASRAAAGAASKTALVLGGGGFTGAVYEIGALRALDLLSVNRSVNQFDVYVGTSAGSLVAALAANGVTPEQMMRVVNNQVPTPFRDINLDMLLRPELPRVRRQGRPAAAAPARGRARRSAAACGAVQHRRPRDRAGRGAAVGPLHRLGRRGVRAHGAHRPRPHRRLPAAASPSSTSPRPTSTRASASCSAPRAGTTCRSRSAVRASAALPMVYKPVEVKDRELIDGGIVSTTNLDIAVEAGAKFIVVVNPLVPYVNDFSQGDPDAARHEGAPRVGHGLPEDRLPDVQAARLPAPARDGAPVAGALPRRRHRPDRARARRRADVPDEHPQLHLAARRRPPRLPVGDGQARLRLRATCARSRSATASRSPPRACARSCSHFGAEKEKSRAWRRILEQTTGALLRQSAAD